MRLYLQCEGMKWNHLPIMGGIYDQHPKMLDDFLILHQAKNVAKARQQEREQRKMKSNSRR